MGSRVFPRPREVFPCPVVCDAGLTGWVPQDTGCADGSPARAVSCTDHQRGRTAVLPTPTPKLQTRSAYLSRGLCVHGHIHVVRKRELSQLPRHPPAAGVDLEGQARDNLKDREEAGRTLGCTGKGTGDAGHGRLLLRPKQTPSTRTPQLQGQPDP